MNRLFHSQLVTAMMLAAVALFFSPSSMEAQLRKPVSPTPLDIKERTIKDLLYFPYGCLPDNFKSAEEARQKLVDTFGICESVNLDPGLHNSDAFDFTYRGTPIGVAFGDWMYNRQWYSFYFDSLEEAKAFYNNLTNDIKKLGIPLVRDKIYGGVSNRNHPVSIFKWVYVIPPIVIKEADESNIHTQDVVRKFMVELGVYKK